MTETLPLVLLGGKVRHVAEAAASWNGNGDSRAEDAVFAAEWFVAECLGLTEKVRRVWAELWKRGQQDLIRDYDTVGTALDDVLVRQISLNEQVAGDSREVAGRTGRDVAGLTELEGTLPEFAAWAERVRAAWPRPSRCRSPLDREQIAQARAALDRGEGEDLADILARLAAGGPLVKE
jgi:hypothetical protein